VSGAGVAMRNGERLTGFGLLLLGSGMNRTAFGLKSVTEQGLVQLGRSERASV
jgi:hypothetical protein